MAASETKKITKKINGTVNSNNEAAKGYTCSMHPEVISDKPGKCPKGGMELIGKNKVFIQNIRATAKLKKILKPDFNLH